MIHESQLRVTVLNRPIPGGQTCGVPLPSVMVEHIPTGCSVTIREGRSQAECRRVAEEALEYALLSMRWKTSDMEAILVWD